MRADWSAGLWRAGVVGLLVASGWLGWAEPAARAAAPDGAYTQDQVTAGNQVYVDSCSSCHGARGEGAGEKDPNAPLVVGPRALTGFRNAQDLYEYVADSMPGDDPGSLQPAQYWAVLAWLLQQNSLGSVDGTELGPATASSVSTRR